MFHTRHALLPRILCFRKQNKLEIIWASNSVFPTANICNSIVASQNGAMQYWRGKQSNHSHLDVGRKYFVWRFCFCSCNFMFRNKNFTAFSVSVYCQQEKPPRNIKNLIFLCACFTIFVESKFMHLSGIIGQHNI